MITGPRDTLKRARKLRSEMSLPERMLWRLLRERPEGFKFRRQHPAGIYILDFYCAGVRLAVEIDGQAHDSERAAQQDAARSDFLRSQHIATLRIPATAIMTNLKNAVTRIIEVCKERAMKISQRQGKPPVPLHHPADGPPPRAGEDRA
ncbi:endonuclease domain-containing protein [Sphingopyxis sp. 2PD]|uniref:endonuclease domain-containing protein n=1 Tax=Sphingopyxis sp. 2PD TaxID=2502196 RepID=UPI0010F4EDD2|nr:endonuclease domain-containing protein [Sphingopyxis sp. 2PD]